MKIREFHYLYGEGNLFRGISFPLNQPFCGMKAHILDLIDIEKVNTLLEGFNKLTGFVTAILDLEGNVISQSGWRTMCTDFHRRHPETSQRCRISDTVLAGKMAGGETYHSYQCLNGLVDVAVPLVVQGEHLANLFSGQFFLETPDEAFFREQSRRYGFDEAAYLESMRNIPIVKEDQVRVAMDFLLNMTGLISVMAYQKLELKELNGKIAANEEKLHELNADLESKVQQRTAQLEETNRELEAFSYSVSHDLRAPLRHINGYVGLLREKHLENLSSHAQHYLSAVETASKQMGMLIDDLLHFSRAGKQEVRRIAFSMDHLVREVLDQVKPARESRSIQWHVSSLPEVSGDYSMLKQVWFNLIDNAVKYTREKNPAEIHIGFYPEPDSLVFSIRDNGVGFDMKYADKLFGVFQRLHSLSEFEGTGIGLALVQRIIHKHNGRTWAEAESGKGATFYFSLPK